MDDQRGNLQCGFGLLGMCCTDCLQGPCRIDPFKDGEQQGLCGRSPESVAMKNLLRRLATGTSLSANYGRRLAVDLLTLDGGKTLTSSRDVRKIGKKLGIEGGNQRKKIAEKALEDFSRQEFTPLNWLKPNLTTERLEVLRRHEALPYNIDVAISEALGAEGEVDDLFLSGIRCALANFSALHLIQDLATILGKNDLPDWGSSREAQAEGKQEASHKTQDSRHRAQDSEPAQPPIVFNDDLQRLAADSIIDGEIPGAALFVGCGELGSKELSLVEKLARNDVLCLCAGCSAQGLGKPSDESLGNSLKNLLRRMAALLGEKRTISPILMLGSCVESIKVMNLLKLVSDRLSVDSSAVPLLGIISERIEDGIEVMGHWMMTLGIPVHWMKAPPLLGSPQAAKVYTETTGSLFGGYALWEKSAGELLKVLKKRSRMLGHG